MYTEVLKMNIQLKKLSPGLVGWSG